MAAVNKLGEDVIVLRFKNEQKQIRQHEANYNFFI